VLARVGETERAEDTVVELADVRRTYEPPGFWVTDLALTLLELGREGDLLAEREASHIVTPWREAAITVARGELVAAADLLESMGAATHEAHARLRAAGRLAEEGARTEAERQLALALDFYRSVGATAFLREGESLLAAAS
jgi:hypothetical protein